MRLMPPALGEMLESEVLTVAVCVRVERRDQVVLGFTDHDQDLLIDGLTYEALSSATPSALRTSAGNTVDTMDFQGILRSDRLTDVDLLSGRFDGAKVFCLICDWKASPITETLLLTVGTVGQIRVTAEAYIAELRSLSQRLRQTIGELISSSCRVRRWADKRCLPPGATSFNPNDFRFDRTISVLPTDPRTLSFAGDDHEDHYYRNGILLFKTGGNIHLERTIKDSKNATGAQEITLHLPFPSPVAIGDQAMLEKGCDRTWAMCRTDYNNGDNFQGEPHVPGLGRLIQVGRH